MSLLLSSLVSWSQLGDLIEPLKEFFQQFYWEIIFLILFAIIGSVYLFGRDRVRRYLFRRKIAPKVQEIVSVYEKEVLPDYVETKPKIIVAEKTQEIPTDLPFGYVFVPEGQEELVWNTLIAYIPICCSLRKIKLLFDETLRKSLFDLLSYELGLKMGKENFAVAYRDHGLKEYEQDYKVMESLYKDKKLTVVILLEASIRLRKTKGHVTASDVEEFSTLVRKIAQVDAIVIRVGGKNPIRVEEIVANGRGVVFLARGKNIKRVKQLSSELEANGFVKVPEEELGLPNPEEGIWYFTYPKVNQVPFMRVWLKPGQGISKER